MVKIGFVVAKRSRDGLSFVTGYRVALQLPSVPFNSVALLTALPLHTFIVTMQQSQVPMTDIRRDLYARSARAQTAWAARPAPNHPAYSAWIEQYRADLTKLGTAMMSVHKAEMVVPPFLLSFLVEHNAAVTNDRSYNFEAFDPQTAPPRVYQFKRDDQYNHVPVVGGWWDDIGTW